MELIDEKQSPYQSVKLMKDSNGYALFLNDMIQFHSEEEQFSHEWMVAVPSSLAKQNKKVLILGGGDGFAAREALKCGAEQVIVVELDPIMVEWTKTNPIMRKLSNDSFNNHKVNVITGDALQFAIDSNEKYDLVIDDCEYLVGDQPSSLEKYFEYLQKLPKLLADGGVGCIMHPIEGTISPAILQKLEDLSPGVIDRIIVSTDSREQMAIASSAILPNVKCQEFISKHLGIELYTYFSNFPLRKQQDIPHAPDLNPLLSSILWSKALIPN